MSQAVSSLTPYLAAAEELRKNREQWKAYESDGHCIVLAGPGSGKTKVLTLKLARLIAEDVTPPRGVACLTYNHECVKELNRRLARLGIRNSRNVYVGTVHSFCLKAVLLPYANMGGLGLPDPLRIAMPSDSERLFSQAKDKVVGVNERLKNGGGDATVIGGCTWTVKQRSGEARTCRPPKSSKSTKDDSATQGSSTSTT